MSDIKNNIFTGVISEAVSEIKSRLNSLLQEKVEQSISGELSIDQKISSLNEKIETTENEDDKKSLNEELSKLNTIKNGLGFTLTENLNLDPEVEAVIKITSRARSLGGDEGTYFEGLLYHELRNKQAAVEFSDWLEENEDVYGYEISILFNDKVLGYEHEGNYELESITNDTNFYFGFSIYLNPEIVQYGEYEIDADDTIEEENGTISEVLRKIKINFRGKKRIKMKCNRGYKWDADKRACVKIAGGDLARMRKSLRRAVLTKRSKGTAYKARVLRKTRKAKRFRKMMGL